MLPEIHSLFSCIIKNENLNLTLFVIFVKRLPKNYALFLFGWKCYCIKTSLNGNYISEKRVAYFHYFYLPPSFSSLETCTICKPILGTNCVSFPIKWASVDILAYYVVLDTHDKNGTYVVNIFLLLTLIISTCSN